MAEQKSTSSGIGLGGAIFIVFLVLKLTGMIDWSWWWVTSPLWIPVALVVVVFVFSVAISWRLDRKRKSKLRRRYDRFQQEREQLLHEQKNRTNNI